MNTVLAGVVARTPYPDDNTAKPAPQLTTHHCCVFRPGAIPDYKSTQYGS